MCRYSFSVHFQGGQITGNEQKLIEIIIALKRRKYLAIILLTLYLAYVVNLLRL